ncbi:MAG: RNAase, partial [Candidatus Hydrogenedentes bacterium]|nr:RNAase [Candidatus Hydrogenedentota bacterium]
MARNKTCDGGIEAMRDVLSRNVFVVKEHVGMFKASNNFDIYDPDSGEVVLLCREPNLGIFTKLLRFTDYKRMTPFDVRVTTPDGAPVITVKRGISIFLSRVRVYDENNVFIGEFKQKLFSIGGAFKVLDIDGNEVCQLKGKWTGWD